MSRLVLGNVNYYHHMTDEGLQLQEGLHHAGWALAGKGFPGYRAGWSPSIYAEGDIPALLGRLNPEIVFVQDPRDWDPLAGEGCFDPTIAFTGLDYLRREYGGFTATVIKDAGTYQHYQHMMALRLGVKAVVIYYSPVAVLAVAPWLTRWPLIRTYHSIDADRCEELFPIEGERKRALVSGALNETFYPLRARAAEERFMLDIDLMVHPGYGAIGNHTLRYLDALSNYKVHLATASKFGFALRKIIESVAMGCTPITDLPAADELPEIDGALVRVPADIPLPALREIIDIHERRWDLGERLYWAERAWQYYDWRPMGKRLSDALEIQARLSRSIALPARAQENLR